MPILNYTTQIDAWKTVGEIQQLLAKRGATHINIRNEGANPVGIMFSISYLDQPLNYSLPCNYKGVLSALNKNKNIAGKLKTEEQALRVGWRIVKDWIEAQMAIVEAEVSGITEVFMPYLVISETGKTLYNAFEEKGMKLLR